MNHEIKRRKRGRRLEEWRMEKRRMEEVEWRK